MSTNKFVMGEEENKIMSENTSTNTASNNSTTITNAQHKKPVRHHVKRRSSGRVHVAKLAPMTRTNSTNFFDTDANTNEDSESNSRPAIKRSQSQRSLHKMSFDRKGLSAMTPRRKSTTSEKIAALQLVSSLPTPSSSSSNDPKAETEVEVEVETKINVEVMEEIKATQMPVTLNPAPLSTTNIAAPVEQTFNAVADSLFVPKTLEYVKTVSPSKNEITSKSTKKQLLRSQFVTPSSDEVSSNIDKSSLDYKSESSHHTQNSTSKHSSFAQQVANRSSHHNSSPALSRTQQKVMLQKQQALADDENSPSHPRNRTKLNKEFDMVGREYRCIRKYQDPMLASLIRCTEKLDLEKTNTQSNASASLRRRQLGAEHHSVSSPNLSSIHHSSKNTTSHPSFSVPHLEQRQIAQRHHHLKAVALSRNSKQGSQHLSSSYNSIKQDSGSGIFSNFPWNATTLLDKLFSTTSTED